MALLIKEENHHTRDGCYHTLEKVRARTVGPMPTFPLASQQAATGRTKLSGYEYSIAHELSTAALSSALGTARPADRRAARATSWSGARLACLSIISLARKVPTRKGKRNCNPRRELTFHGPVRLCASSFRFVKNIREVQRASAQEFSRSRRPKTLNTNIQRIS